ncbi:hypothetical protein EYF80_013692 [Liparis tanakae]|uniref:Uncharacterized protein n=1 Tax=Liparis tanakae TaxID=230148 RepID=A0A4Z2IEG9_9TELE|nr:hypothetical protein EYF80_013692 [Liparis tanakae]
MVIISKAKAMMGNFILMLVAYAGILRPAWSLSGVADDLDGRAGLIEPGRARRPPLSLEALAEKKLIPLSPLRWGNSPPSSSAVSSHQVVLSSAFLVDLMETAVPEQNQQAQTFACCGTTSTEHAQSRRETGDVARHPHRLSFILLHNDGSSSFHGARFYLRCRGRGVATSRTEGAEAIR